MLSAYGQTSERKVIPLGVIVGNPGKYNQESVITLGKISDAYDIGVICSYILNDKGQQIHVSSTSGCPEENESYLVQGNLSVSSDGSKIILKETTREHIDMEAFSVKQEGMKPPPPPKVIEILDIVEDDSDTEYEIIIEDVDADTEFEFEFLANEEDEESDKEEIFYIVEDMPSFQGQGQEGFRAWIAENLRYPEVAAERGISGKVYVQLVVNSKGDVTDAVVVRGVDPDLDKEAIRVVTSSPKWEPGRQRGRPVSVRFTFPIVFAL